MEAGTDSTALTLASGAAFLLFAGGFWVIASLGQWALAPAERAVVQTRSPLQFSFHDLLVLMLQEQAGIAACLWWCDLGSAPATVAVVAAAVSIAAMWGHGVKRLSRCGVHSPLRRGVFLLVISPGTCAAIVAALWINGRAVVDLLTGLPSPWMPWLAQNAIVLAVFILCRLGTVWVMSNMPPSSEPAIAEDGIRYVSS